LLWSIWTNFGIFFIRSEDRLVNDLRKLSDIFNMSDQMAGDKPSRESSLTLPGARVLTFGFDQLQNPELLFRDVRERDRQPDALRVQNPEASSHESAARRVHRLFEEILRTARPMADVDGLPIRTARGAAIQLCLRRVTTPATPEHAVGAFFVRPAQPALVQHRPDQESNARLFRPVAGRGYSGSSSASIASCAMTSDTAADL